MITEISKNYGSVLGGRDSLTGPSELSSSNVAFEKRRKQIVGCGGSGFSNNDINFQNLIEFLKFGIHSLKLSCNHSDKTSRHCLNSLILSTVLFTPEPFT